MKSNAYKKIIRSSIVCSTINIISMVALGYVKFKELLSKLNLIIILLGVTCTSISQASIHIKRVSTDQWTGRSYFSSSLYKNNIWLFGGLKQGDDSPLDSHDVYSSINNGITWDRQNDPLFEARDDLKTTVFKDKLYMIGGGGGDVYYNDVWSYDGESWGRHYASFKKREGFVLLNFKNKLWVISGAGSDEYIWSSEDGFRWYKSGTLPDGLKNRRDSAYFVYNNNAYIVSGRTADKKIPINDVWRSQDGTTWTKIGKFKIKDLSNMSYSVYNGKMWIVGGFEYKSDQPDAEINTKKIYTSTNGLTWNEVTDVEVPWEPMNGSSLVSLKDSLLLIGGREGKNKFSSSVWEITENQ